VLAGMRAPERPQTELLLDQLRWLDIDVDWADAAGAMARNLRRSCRGLQFADCLIARGTTQLGASLLTQNVRHFPMIPGLTPAYARQPDAP
jgi:predicted nucleic acid-binding protein